MMPSPSQIRDLLVRKHLQITSQLLPIDLLSHLVEKQVLTIQEMEIVKNTSGGMTAKASKLLALLDRKPDEMLPIFVQCLRDTKQNHVADILEGEVPTVAAMPAHLAAMQGQGPGHVNSHAGGAQHPPPQPVVMVPPGTQMPQQQQQQMQHPQLLQHYMQGAMPATVPTQGFIVYSRMAQNKTGQNSQPSYPGLHSSEESDDE